MARTLLGVLALRANRAVPVATLVSALWPEQVPASAAANVRSHIAELRRLLPPGGPTLQAGADGYALLSDATGVDALHFRQLLTGGRRLASAGDAASAADRYAKALALWRGPVLAGESVPALVAAEAVVLDDLRLRCLEELVDVRFTLGQHYDVVPLLKGAIADHPLHERLWHQLLLALLGTGRRAEAREHYRRLAALLDAELGVTPDPATARLFTAPFPWPATPPVTGLLRSVNPSTKGVTMALSAVLDAEEIIARWREGLDLSEWGSPAGPLFASGKFAEGDIVACNPPGSRCSACTASQQYYCC